jgi:hypothetical protein
VSRATRGAQLDFQRRVLELLTGAIAVGEATPRQLAYLTDRVRMLEGLEQLYGTQLIGSHEGPVPYRIEDLDHVDARRSEVALEPLPEYLTHYVRNSPEEPAEGGR